MYQKSIYSLIALILLVGCDQQLNQSETQTEPETPVSEPATTDNQASTNQTPTAEDSRAITTDGEIMMAVCELEPIGDSGVSGTIHFEKKGDSIHVRGEVTGLKPGKHGFHVHETGDLSDKETGKSAGGHFNPTNQPHGQPSDQQRHVGDLGNINAGEDGKATIEIEDQVIELNGENSIVGHALVVHAQEDKFTQPTGDAGDRVAFGLIEASE